MSATLKSEIPGGAIQSQKVDQDVSDYLAGRTVTQRLVIAVVEIDSVTVENLQVGRVNKAKYKTVHMAEVRDPHEIDQMRHRVTQLRADQGLAVSQPTLFAASDAEQCEGLIDLIRDWGSAKDLGITELDKKWHEILGGGGENEGLAESFIACRSPQQLKDFAYTLGVISDSPVVDDKDEDEEAREGEGEEAEPDAESTDQPALAVVGSVPFMDVTG